MRGGPYLRELVETGHLTPAQRCAQTELEQLIQPRNVSHISHPQRLTIERRGVDCESKLSRFVPAAELPGRTAEVCALRVGSAGSGFDIAKEFASRPRNFARSPQPSDKPTN